MKDFGRLSKQATSALCVIALLATSFACAFGQGTSSKRALTHQDYDSWPSIQSPQISRDGKFIAYAFMAQDANRAIAPSLVLEFTQSAVRGMGPIEHESLAALAERGFHFSLDNVADLRIEPRELANRGFRFIKIHASLLLNRSGTAASDIHPADLSDLLGRFGIDLIAERIESEGSVVDLLDYDVRYGQGFLFAPPRPVRAEALQGIADRTDVVAREAGAAPDQVAPVNAAGRSADAPAPEPGKPERTTGLAQLARGVVTRG